MTFKVKGHQFLLEVSPRIDMSDMDTPIDLEKIHEYQLILCRGSEEKDDIFLGNYPDKLLAAHAGMHVFYYMNGKLTRRKLKFRTLAIAAILALAVLVVWPSRTTQHGGIITTTIEVPKQKPK